MIFPKKRCYTLPLLIQTVLCLAQNSDNLTPTSLMISTGLANTTLKYPAASKHWPGKTKTASSRYSAAQKSTSSVNSGNDSGSIRTSM